MSLINDALRRASNAAPTSAVPPVIPRLEMPPLLSNASDSALPPLREPFEEPKSKLPFILAALFVCCAVGAATVYLWEKKRSARSAAQVSATSSAPVHSTASAGESVSAPEASSAAAPAPAPVATAPVAAAPADAAPQTPVTFPPLRLQSIYYKPSNPSVMINGRTLYLNEEIQGVTVAGIDPSSVTLVLSGRTNVLTLR